MRNIKGHRGAGRAGAAAGQVTQGLMGHDEVSGFYSTQVPRWDTLMSTKSQSWAQAGRTLGPLGVGVGFSDRGSLSSSKYGVGGDAQGGPTIGVLAPSCHLCRHGALNFLGNRQFSAQLHAGQKMQSRAVTRPLITGERAPHSWDRKTRAVRLITRFRSSWRGRHPLTERPGPASQTRNPALDPPSPGPRAPDAQRSWVRCGRPPAQAQSCGRHRGLGIWTGGGAARSTPAARQSRLFVLGAPGLRRWSPATSFRPTQHLFLPRVAAREGGLS